MQFKRLTLFAGHYGSGKTNIAVNWAMMLRGQGLKVALADLDIVNPYYRAKDSAGLLQRAGIRLISSPFANSNVDVPALPGEMYAAVDDHTAHAVLDVGGDDRGALALGRLVPAILRENNYEMLFVINRFRPLTRDAVGTMEVLREIEEACRLPFTAIVHNSNLGAETTAETLLASWEYAAEVARLSGLPVKMTAVEQALYEQLEGQIPNLFPLQLQRRPTEGQPKT